MEECGVDAVMGVSIGRSHNNEVSHNNAVMGADGGGPS